MSAPTGPLEELQRLQVTRLTDGHSPSGLAGDVVAGFTRCPKQLSPKYLYDEYGSKLFDAICDTPEYYPTRTEQALLEAVADEIVAEGRPTHLVELGSGAARKTRVLLDAMAKQSGEVCYMPVDISEEILVLSARELLVDYPTMTVHGVVADYDYHLHLLPREGRRLIAFLGSTLGNFRQPDAIRFLRALASGMGPDDRLLLGLDLVKPTHVLEAAYNDAAGFTAEFNRNVLRVLNRELGANFEVDRFRHVAQYAPERKQMSMQLEAQGTQVVNFPGLGRTFHFTDGERIETEISRKFDRERAERITSGAGLQVRGWHESPDRYYGLLVASVV